MTALQETSDSRHRGDEANDYDSMLWFPHLKRWAALPEYRDASLIVRAIVDGALTVFMSRGSLPATPEGLRRAIGADEEEFARGWQGASLCIAILRPRWEAELADAWSRWESIRERNRNNGRKGGRKPKTQPEAEPKAGGEPIENPVGSPVETPSLSTSTSTITDLSSERSPHTPSLRSGGGVLPKGFDAFWDAFKAAYPRRPGQPWAEGKRAALKAFKAHPELRFETILDGAEAYARLMNSTGKTGTDKVAHASTWLNGVRWECDYDTARTGGASGWDDEAVF